MWAAVATPFVFRETREGSVSAGISRLIATCVRFVLCFIYIALFSVNAAGIGVVIGLGTIVMIMLRRPDDVTTTGITTTVVLVVAAIDPKHALAQPPLRLLDTVVGVAVGVLLKGAASYAMARAGLVAISSSEPVRPPGNGGVHDLRIRAAGAGLFKSRSRCSHSGNRRLL
jgi:hypothetical protein